MTIFYCKNYVNEIYNLNIKINKYEDNITKNMTLTGSVEINKSIYEQIRELSKFKFYLILAFIIKIGNLIILSCWKLKIQLLLQCKLKKISRL